LRLVLAGAAVVLVLFLVSRLGGGTAPADNAGGTPGETVRELAAPRLPAVTGREVFVAPDGKPTNPGTRQAPVDLATALSSNTPASPGDLIWLRGGTYAGNFTSALTGSDAAPIQVRQYPGERATIAPARAYEPALIAGGSNTWFRDFEISSSGRIGSLPPEVQSYRQGAGVAVTGRRIGLVNLIIHDVVKGIDVRPGASEIVIAGNLVHDTGWIEPAQGSGIKVGAGSGDSFMLDNIVFRSGTTGISVSMKDSDRLLLEGNASFNNGFATEFFDRNLLVEGGRMVVNDNFTYYRPGKRGGENNFGYTGGCIRIDAARNYWAHAEAYPFTLSKCEGTLRDSTLIGASEAAARFPDNTFIRSNPTGLATFVRQDRYDESRVRIVIFNWDRHPTVNVDVSAINLAPGTTYEIRDAQNYFAGPIATGTYEGRRLQVPMTGLKPVRPPTAPASVEIVHPAPEFGAFLLIKSPERPGAGGRP
jgi:hypothetical protein